MAAAAGELRFPIWQLGHRLISSRFVVIGQVVNYATDSAFIVALYGFTYNARSWRRCDYRLDNRLRWRHRNVCFDHYGLRLHSRPARLTANLRNVSCKLVYLLAPVDFRRR